MADLMLLTRRWWSSLRLHRRQLWRLLDYMQHKGVWITQRVDIANHWVKTHPYPGKGLNE